jgi:hypothetical protein
MSVNVANRLPDIWNRHSFLRIKKKNSFVLGVHNLKFSNFPTTGGCQAFRFYYNVGIFKPVSARLCFGMIKHYIVGSLSSELNNRV